MSPSVLAVGCVIAVFTLIQMLLFIQFCHIDLAVRHCGKASIHIYIALKFSSSFKCGLNVLSVIIYVTY